MLHPIENRQTLLDNRLGSLLTLERDSLEVFEELEQASQSSAVRELFARQSAEARDHISTLEKLIATLRLEQSDVPAPTSLGLHDEARTMVENSDAGAVDMAVLTTALTAEHLAVDAYRTAVALSASLGFAGVSAVLARNLLEQEQIGEDLESAFRDELLDAHEAHVSHHDFGQWEHAGASAAAAIVDDGTSADDDAAV